jgi:hypothetical protein
MVENFIYAAGNAYDKYSVFYPTFGNLKQFKYDFIFYGQSIKGWEPNLKEFESQTKEEFINACIAYSNDYDEKRNHSPLDWVNVYWSNEAYKETCGNGEKEVFYPPMKYRTHRSYFWNVVYKLVNKYYGSDENSWGWTRKIVWSNLYKVAPTAGENPSDTDCNWQWPGSLELVKMEIEQIKPKYCIFLTNLSWMEGFDDLMKNKINASNNLIQYVGLYNNTTVIVTKRPFLGNSSFLVSEILNLIDKNI